MFHILDGGDLALYVGEVLEEGQEQLGPADGGIRLRVEVVEELVRPGHQLFEHAALYTRFVTGV